METRARGQESDQRTLLPFQLPGFVRLLGGIAGAADQLVAVGGVQVLMASILTLACLGAGAAIAQSAPIEVKVVVVTMFEIGADSGDTAGEFQLWKERQKLDTRLPFAHHHDLFFNEKTGVLAMVTGEGTAN